MKINFFKKKEHQPHNPYKHREIFDKFIENLSANREGLFSFSAENSNNLEDYKKQITVMSDMHYIYKWILANNGEAKTFLNLFDALLINIERFDPSWKFIDREKYDTQIKRTVEDYVDSYSKKLKIRGIIDESNPSK